MVGSGVFGPFCVRLLDDVRPIEQAHDQLRAKVRIPAHLAEGLLRPELNVAALERELFRTPGRKVAVRDSLAFILHGHDIFVFGVVLLVIEVRQRLDGPGKTGMRRYVVDALPRVPNLAAIAQRFDVIRPCSVRHND